MKKYILLIINFAIAVSMSAQCTDAGNYWNESWVSCTTSTNPNPMRGASQWMLFEFHTPQFIDSTHIWNANRTGESGWGAKDVVVDYSDDGGASWIQLGQYTFPQGSEMTSYTGFPGPDFAGIQLDKILFTILSTHDGGNCASLAEVQFLVDPNACIGTVDVCGVCNGPGETTWYLDADGDGLGDINSPLVACTQPAGYVINNNDLCDDGRLGWSDIQPLFIDHGCTGCHGGNAQGGLDLTSYTNAAAGGTICGTSMLTGTHLVDIIDFSGYSGCGTPMPLPAMNNRVSNPLNAQELTLIQNWVDGGAPELCTDFVESCTDLVVVLSVVPSNIVGISTIGTAVEVSEINGRTTDSNSPIKVRIPSDARLNFTWDPTLTSVAFRTVHNNEWSYLGNTGIFHEFEYNQPIVGYGKKSFGYIASYDPQNTQGETTVTASVVPFSGGECELVNNADAEKLVYFD